MRTKTNYAERPNDLEILTGNKDESIIVFRVNIEEIETEDGTAYQADEYRLSVPTSANIEARVRSHADEWKARAMSEDYNRTANEVRAKRNALLSDTDKDMAFDRLRIILPEKITATTMLAGFTDFVKSFKEIENGPMSVYRQALRDLPEQPGFPYEVEFPDKPE